MKTHTPGPWKAFNCVGPRSLKNWHIQADGLKGRPVATIADIGDGDAANAHLISAAPEMLAALELAKQQLRNGYSDNFSDSEIMRMCPAYKLVVEVIAKAKGQQ